MLNGRCEGVSGGLKPAVQIRREINTMPRFMIATTLTPFNYNITPNTHHQSTKTHLHLTIFIAKATMSVRDVQTLTLRYCAKKGRLTAIMVWRQLSKTCRKEQWQGREH